jgi:PAS domain S-box-containing protein
MEREFITEYMVSDFQKERKILFCGVKTDSGPDLQSSLTRLGYHVCAQAITFDGITELIGRHHPDLVVLHPGSAHETDYRNAANVISENLGAPVLLALSPDDPNYKQIVDDYPYNHVVLPCRDDELVFRAGLAIQLGEMNAERQAAEENLRRRTQELNERVKELNCLYDISQIIEITDISLDETLQGIVDAIPGGWQYPETTHAVIFHDDKWFNTKNRDSKETPWTMTCDLVAKGSMVGHLSIMYLEERPARDIGPFLHEEYLLCRIIAERTGRIIERYLNLNIIKYSEEKYRNIVEDLPGFICTFDENYILKFVNANYCHAFNKTCDEIVGRTFLDVIPDPDRKAVQDHIAVLNKEIPVRTHVHRVILPDNEVRWQRWTNRAVYTDKGLLREYQSIGEDITELKHAEQEKENAYLELENRVRERTLDLIKLNENLQNEIEERMRIEEELKKSSDELKFFAYSMIHDLKNPAISTYGLTKRLLKKNQGNLDEKSLEYCRQIVSSVDHIKALVEMVNLFISAKESSIAMESLNLSELLSQVKSEFNARIKKMKIKWIQPGRLPVIQADPVSLIRVFRNLIDNALKYGGPKLSKIELGYRSDNQFHILSVADDGEGIRLNESDDIFGMFKRNAVHKKIEGSGIGLAVVKELIKQHRGNVWVESDTNVGTSFFISIPRERPIEDSACTLQNP